MKIIISCLFFFLSSFVFSQDNNGIVFIQKGKKQIVRDSISVIQLDRAAFSIQFNGKKYDSEHFHATQIAVIASKVGLYQARIGQKTDAIPYFEPGTGMAPNHNNMYNTMIVSDLAHHYIYYESEQDKRAYLVNQKEGMLQLEWNIQNCYYEGKEYTFEELPAKSLYLILFSDQNCRNF